MKILSLDQLNKTCQFDVTESASGISFVFNKTAELNYKVELLSKNDTNKTLFEGSETELSSVLSQFIDFNGNFIPFANRKNLILNNDTKLRITIDWKTAEDGETVTSIAYDLTSEFEDTAKPLVIIKEKFSLSEDIETENYDYLMLPQKFESYESITQLSGKQVKQFHTKATFEALTRGVDSDRLLKTFSGQKVKINVAPADGEQTYYLIQY